MAKILFTIAMCFEIRNFYVSFQKGFYSPTEKITVVAISKCFYSQQLCLSYALCKIQKEALNKTVMSVLVILAIGKLMPEAIMEISPFIMCPYGRFVRVRFSVECVLLGAIILRLAGNGNPEYPHALDGFG